MRWTRMRIRPEIDIAWVSSDSPRIGLNERHYRRSLRH
jgi:hypothetical protein